MKSLEENYQLVLERTKGGKYCPAHEDKNPSLSVSLSDDQTKILAKCHAGCSFRQIVRSLGMQKKDFFSQNLKTRKEVCRYPYENSEGILLYEVIRYEPKEFKVKQANGSILGL